MTMSETIRPTRGSTRHRVAVLALDAVVPLDLGIPAQVFGTYDEAPYAVTLCGERPGPVRTCAGFSVVAEAGLEALAEADTVIVPGTHCVPVRRDGVLPPAVAEALALVPEHARWMSICTGAFVLAAAGRLDGRRATTHWARAADFRRLFPAVELDEDVLFVDDGDLLTSAGLAAGIDLCLHLLRRDHGSEVANAVARHAVVAPWRDGGPAQFITAPVPEDRAEGGTAAARTWALEHLAEPIAVADLAAVCSMSVRTFTRRFRAETGHSPAAWLLAQRLAHARHLLETTTLPVDRVAAASGLGSASSLRAHLGATLGVSPLAYRRRWAASSA
jgi:transcriptional regulator GlxA family with amidase domain